MITLKTPPISVPSIVLPHKMISESPELFTLVVTRDDIGNFSLMTTPKRIIAEIGIFFYIGTLGRSYSKRTRYRST